MLFLRKKEIKTDSGGTYYRMCIGGFTEQIPCRVKRKQKTEIRKQKRNVLRTGFKIEYVGIDNYYGFTLDCDNLYVIDDFTVIKNSGKSSFAMAQGYDTNKVIVLTKTKNLQVQYANSGYDATILFGKSSYPCVHHMMPAIATAEDCRYSSGMYNCQYSNHCTYFLTL